MANTIKVFHNGKRLSLRSDEVAYLRKCGAVGPLQRRPPSVLVYTGLVASYDGCYGVWEVTERGYAVLAMADERRA